jgi:hypothetical protein
MNAAAKRKAFLLFLAISLVLFMNVKMCNAKLDKIKNFHERQFANNVLVKLPGKNNILATIYT